MRPDTVVLSYSATIHFTVFSVSRWMDIVGGGVSEKLTSQDEHTDRQCALEF
jgi:hypothetical protein